MEEIEDAVYKFYDHLNSKHLLKVPKEVKFYIYDLVIIEDDESCQFNARIQEYDYEVQILIAGRSPYGPLILLAHEHCHLLQMYKWKTWPSGMIHPSQDDDLEVQARSFAENEVDLYQYR
jgi:hypothetical protein